VRGAARELVSYVTKYIVKPYEFQRDAEGWKWAVQFLKSFKGVRRIHSYGCFYNAGMEIEREPFKCPFCFGEYVFVDHDRLEMGWSTVEARMTGMQSYADAMGAWGRIQLTQAPASA
jgi:hypothetical protein